MPEKHGVVTFQGNPLTLLGDLPAVGAKAPEFTVLTNDVSPVGLADFTEKVLVVVSVPSVDTPVCDLETRRFNAEATGLGPQVRILVVSMDLPFAQKRWCAAAGVDRVTTLSDHALASFGQAYGVLIKELRLLARAVFVLNTDRAVTYAQLVPEITSEPDYAAALDAARAALA
ncbi:thiol peroxidase [Desulfolutivibrio sulfoxidireducens]|uniref:thiol peroxidase n=1 Tax=Desulfolutivibrio sulfoxidireducens TaxID=2773299 RepID=UPI00159D9FFC|nr:thiol peroxidase [Desulfolutivibrio sulfoxidireducens]QLA15196.1 thiol peroxidase [Desulfolutivibrio sulfoxidireducens]QLA18767.1 thiol peroxidase [Desulfolutivibrio sulfoxidireducens]